MNKKLMEDLRGALARGYCTERNKHKVLDPDLIEDMVTQAHDQIIELWKECLPKKREVIKELYGNATNTANYGFNQAIDQAQKNMEG